MLPGPPSAPSLSKSCAAAEIAEHAARPYHHRSQRIFRDGDRQAQSLADALIQVLEHRAGTGEHDAAVADVRAQLGRRALERTRMALTIVPLIRQRLANLAVVDGDGAGLRL